MTVLEPRKIPKQRRAHVTVDAIVDACAQILAREPYETLTTNHISERAGVSIGTLYEYFPNRESIVAALAARSFHRIVEAMTEAAGEAANMEELAGVEHLLSTGIETLASERYVFKVLLREAPFVAGLPVVKEAREALTGLTQMIRVQAEPRMNLPAPEADAWLISQMLYGAMQEVAFIDDPERRTFLMHELARLVFRMAMGRDPGPPTKSEFASNSRTRHKDVQHAGR